MFGPAGAGTLNLISGVDGDDALLQHLAITAQNEIGTKVLAPASSTRKPTRPPLSDNAEARRLREHDASVDLVRTACNQRVESLL